MTNYKFTLTQIKYLIWIYRLTQNGCGIKNVELASALGLTKPSVHSMLKTLSELGMVRQQTFGLAHLTGNGYLIAQKYAVCFCVLERTMSEICGSGTVSENALCALLADMPWKKIDELYNEHWKQEMII